MLGQGKKNHAWEIWSLCLVLSSGQSVPPTRESGMREGSSSPATSLESIQTSPERTRVGWGEARQEGWGWGPQNTEGKEDIYREAGTEASLERTMEGPVDSHQALLLLLPTPGCPAE